MKNITLEEQFRAKPKIIYDKYREGPLFQNGQPVYHILQIWFKNSPIATSEESVAKQVTATIQFWDKKLQKMFCCFSGRWVMSLAPGFFGFKNTSETIDIMPNDKEYKLNIALKWEEDEDCYGYAIESFLGQYKDGRNPDFALGIGKYNVCVKLKGVGVNCTHWFNFVNQGSKGVLVLSTTNIPLKKLKDLNK